MIGKVTEFIKKDLKITAGNKHKCGDEDSGRMPELTDGDEEAEDWRHKPLHKQEKGRKDPGCLEDQRCPHAIHEDSKQADVEWFGWCSPHQTRSQDEPSRGTRLAWVQKDITYNQMTLSPWISSPRLWSGQASLAESKRRVQ